MDGTRQRLLRSLNQGGFRTGTEIGALLGLSRAAVHKHVQALVAQGVPIHRVPGRGYRLADGVSLLDAQAISGSMTDEAQSLVSGIDILEEVASTSRELAQQGPAGPFHCRVCLAEKQTAGRGRRGRSWVAVPYRDLMMSIGIEYARWPAHLPTLGLVTALTIVEALEGLDITGLAVKWPNDVVHAHGKVCGVLLDVTGEAHGACRIVAGIGINLSTGDDEARDVDQRWTDLAAIAGRVPERNTVVAHCLNLLLPVFRDFPEAGFGPWRPVWHRLDALRGRLISIHGADGGVFEGRAAGVDEHGRLVVVGDDGRARVFTQGDVSVKVP